jgi:ubiquitin carboxyl-terminal hydrolase 34
MMCPSDSVRETHSSMTESSRTRSDSLEASSSQQDRKRPRLDSGNNDGLRSEEALTDSGFPEPSISHSSPQKKADGGACRSNSSSPVPSAMEPSSNGPLSRVTINTRSVTNNTADPLESSEDLSQDVSTSEKSPGAAGTPVDSTSGTDMVLPPPDTISIHSSPSQSPEIQIAVVEDIDQDPSETNWTPVTRLTDSLLLQEQANPYYVSRTFPYAHQGTEGFMQELLSEISKIFVQGLLITPADGLQADLMIRR